MHENLMQKAYQFSALSLIGKKRYSGDLYEDHGLKVKEILQTYGVQDPSTLAVAILHHSVEDGVATLEDVEKEFGLEIASMLKTLDELKILKITDASHIQLAESLRQMFLYLAKDLRIVLIKLADILDNLRTLQFVPKEHQKAIAKQALDIFAPLAERLGMGELKGQMQDLAFPFVYPEEHLKVKKLFGSISKRLDKRLQKIKVGVIQALEEESISFRIESRSKHIYSLYLKLKRPEINFDINKVYDLIAFRVVVKNTADCYRVLGIVHNLFRPVPNRLKDFIAIPKPNGYRSIHTTVFGINDEPFEIQIRTEKMHEEAEFGVAAHWHYDEAKSKVESSELLNKGIMMDEAKLAWVKSLQKWQEEITDNAEFLKTIKTDFFGQRIFVLTPRGDVRDLPQGATPIDFAYYLHTYLGDKAIGAKVNGKMVTLNYKLKSGDVVEILISKDKNKKPNRDWLNFVTTSHAKKLIKRAYK